MTDIQDPKIASVPNNSDTGSDFQFETWEELLFHFYGEGPYYSWHFESLIQAGFRPKSDR